MRRTALLTLALGMAAAGPLQAQDETFESQVSPEVLAAVQPILDMAVRDSLPLAPLESKILEGVAKGVPAARIAPVARQLAADLGLARTRLREGLPDTPLAGGEISGAALAMRQGVSPEQLLGLWEDRPPRSPSLEIPLAVVGELARRGVAPDEAVEVMRHALSTGTPMSAAAQLPSRMDLVGGVGRGPQEALHEALRRLGITLPPQAGRGRGRPGGPPGQPPGGGRPGG